MLSLNSVEQNNSDFQLFLWNIVHVSKMKGKGQFPHKFIWFHTLLFQEKYHFFVYHFSCTRFSEIIYIVHHNLNCKSSSFNLKSSKWWKIYVLPLLVFWNSYNYLHYLGSRQVIKTIDPLDRSSLWINVVQSILQCSGIPLSCH